MKPKSNQNIDADIVYNEPAQIAWEGLRRNRDFQLVSREIIRFLSNNDVEPFNCHNIEEFLAIDTDIWSDSKMGFTFWHNFALGDHLIDHDSFGYFSDRDNRPLKNEIDCTYENFWLFFGLKFWLPPSFPAHKVGWEIWEDCYVTNLTTICPDTVPGLAKKRDIIAHLKSYRENFSDEEYVLKNDLHMAAKILRQSKPDEFVYFSVLLQDPDEAYQKIVVLDSRRPKEHQLMEIANLLENMECVSKKEGHKPDYDQIKKWFKVYDLHLFEEKSQTEVIAEVWEDEISLDDNLPVDEWDARVDAEDSKIKIAMFKDYIEKASVLAGNKPKTRKAKYHYTDYLKYRDDPPYFEITGKCPCCGKK